MHTRRLSILHAMHSISGPSSDVVERLSRNEERDDELHLADTARSHREYAAFPIGQSGPRHVQL